MSCEYIQTDIQNSILTIRISRPEKKNALNLAMYKAMSQALIEADSKDEVRVVILTGVDGCFSSGNDLSDFMGELPPVESNPIVEFIRVISSARKPIVAAVNGAAVGVGVTMLLHCDLVYAGSSASFQMPFVNLGLCPEAGSTLLLPRMMGHQRAAELLLLGETFSAEKACSYGIVNAVFPDNDLMQAAQEKAMQLAEQPAAAVRFAKSLLKKNNHALLQETILDEAIGFFRRLKSPEAGEAFKAFVERRKPDFSRFK